MSDIVEKLLARTATRVPDIVSVAAADTITALRAEVEALKDPNVVHVNMLRGGIAQPSIAQIIHIYGEDAILAALTQTKDTTDDA